MEISSKSFAYSMSNFVITLSAECLLKANGFIIATWQLILFLR